MTRNDYHLTISKPQYKRKWYAYLDIIDFILKEWDTIDDLLHEDGKSHLKVGIDQTCISQLKDTISYFKKTLDLLEGTNYPTIHMTYPYLNFLTSICQSDLNDFAILQEFRKELLNGINITIIPSLNLQHKTALFLIPPANSLTTFTKTEQKNTHDFVKFYMTKFHDSNIISTSKNASPNNTVDLGAAPNTASTSTCNDQLLSQIINQNYLKNQSIDILAPVESEFNKYQSERFDQMSAEFDILDWWDGRKSDYPLLYKLSNSILSIPATTAAYNNLYVRSQRLLHDPISKISSKNLNDSAVVVSNFKNNCLSDILIKIVP
jgi:hypothetical protein